ncbi:MAG: CHASE2 domain-containing protein [Cyanobacteria bacterium P01_D01_bin.1]
MPIFRPLAHFVMFSKIRSRISKSKRTIAVGLTLVGTISLATVGGFFESAEIGVLDQFFRLRASKAEMDSRILIVTISEEDITELGQWPMSDDTLSRLLHAIDNYHPVAIGIDIYRNLSVEPGSEALIEAFEQMPTVIGAERVVNESVPPHATLQRLQQSASVDLVIDDDGRVRRGLMSVMTSEGEIKQGMAATLALIYLGQLDIAPQIIEGSNRHALILGQSKITRFEEDDGGYVDADDGGYQILMNYKGGHQRFETISMSAVLSGELTDEMVEGRVVLIGSTAISLNDLFHTPMHVRKQVPGIHIHAHLISQLLDAAIEGRPLLRTLPTYAELLWVAAWLTATFSAYRSALLSNSVRASLSAWKITARLAVLSGALGLLSYAFFLSSWWFPVALPFVSILGAVGVSISYRHSHLQQLAALDELTQVANRRYFDQYLADALHQCDHVSLILCDVDHFKLFNDSYGHPAGDSCLQKVAQALKSAVRRQDLVARYGGEEFVIVLPNTQVEEAKTIADRIRRQVYDLKVLHESSKVDKWVTISGGLASVSAKDALLSHQVVEYADQALYGAKQSGRNRIMTSQWRLSSEQDRDDNDITDFAEVV